MKRASVVVGRAIAQYSGAGIIRMAQAPGGALAIVYIDHNSDVVWTKSTDGGLSWALPTAVFTGTAGQLASWYDRDSGINGDLLHCAYTDTAISDVLYRNIDIISGAMSTQTTVFAGASFSSSVPTIDITRARGGNLHCVGAIDGGVETFAMRSTNVGATWAPKSSPMEGATNDYVILAPGWSSDPQDVMCFFWDASASEVSVKYYDDFGDLWTEALISTGMVTGAPSVVGYPNWALAVDLANSRQVLIAWTGADTATADLKCWSVAGENNAPVITAKTNVVTDGVDDQGYAALTIDQKGQWWAFYFGKSDGTETFLNPWNAYCKLSLDEGSSWGTETQITDSAKHVNWAGSCMQYVGVPPIAYGFASKAMIVNVSVDPAGQAVGVRWQEAVT